MSGDGTNFIAFACGRKRSGKSHILAQLGAKFPRRIVYDFIGEFYGKIPDAVEARSLDAAINSLHKLARVPRWTLLCIIDPSEVPDLVGVIAPVGSIPEETFSYSVGGIVQECGECDLILPNNAGIRIEMRDSIQRGRHFRLSSLFATQRPRDTHRVLTSQADVMLAFKQHEPRDVDFLGQIMRPDVATLARTLQPRQFLRFYNDGSEVLEFVDGDGSARIIPEGGNT